MPCTLGAVWCGDPVCPGHGVLRTPKAQTSLPNSISGQGRSRVSGEGGREGGNAHSQRYLHWLPLHSHPLQTLTELLGADGSPKPACPWPEQPPRGLLAALPEGEKFRNAEKLTARLTLQATAKSKGLKF